MHLESASWGAGIASCVVAIAVAFHQFGREKMLKRMALICVILVCLAVLVQVVVLNPRPPAIADPASHQPLASGPVAPVASATPGAASDIERTPIKQLEAITNSNGRNPAPISAVSFAGREAGEVKRIKCGSTEVVLCWCPAGTFTMGSPMTEADRDDNDEGLVEVRLTKGFWAMQTEVTQDLYEVLMGNNPSKFEGKRLPVEKVNYPEAIACGAKLTQKLRESGALPAGWEIRLPTDAQWEYMARAGTKTATPFGDSLSSNQANFNGNDSYGGVAKGPFLYKTKEVGSYKPNFWGLYDTAGNVFEWTLDAFEAKLPGGADPFVAGTGASDRVIRGGSWICDGSFCRSASRGRGLRERRIYDLGFRLIATQSE